MVVADMTEVPEWLLVRTGLPKGAEMADDTRIPLRFFKKCIRDRMSDSAGETVYSEKDKDTGKEKLVESRVVVEDTRIPFRYFRSLHSPLDILEACSEDNKDQDDKQKASSKESDLMLKDVKEKSVFGKVGKKKKHDCTRELMKEINDSGRDALRTM